MRRLMFMGPPGAGKGTQASRLAEHLGVPHIATGDMFRAARETDSPLGKRVAEFMDRGELVPDDLVNEAAMERLENPDARGGFILDGYPRTADQVEALDHHLKKKGIHIEAVLRFMITKEEIVKRLSGRRVCPKCGTSYHLLNKPPKEDELCDLDGSKLVQREDDREEAILTRLEEYGKQTKPLFDLYTERGQLIEIDAIGTSDEVFKRLTEATGV